MKSNEAQDLFAALAHETRLEIFRLLVRAGCDGMAAGSIASALELPAATLSFHLKELKSAGAVTVTRRGRSLVYRPDFSVMGELVRFLTAHCCEGFSDAIESPRG